jgi:hypothetical protein
MEVSIQTMTGWPSTHRTPNDFENLKAVIAGLCGPTTLGLITVVVKDGWVTFDG